MRNGKNGEIEVAILRWIREAIKQNIILTGDVLKEKVFFSNAFGVPDFACSNAWF